MTKHDHIRKGQTWATTDKHCPECGGAVSTNFEIFDCIDCEWWEVVNSDE